MNSRLSELKLSKFMELDFIHVVIPVTEMLFISLKSKGIVFMLAQKVSQTMWSIG